MEQEQDYPHAKIVEDYKEYLKRMLNGSAPIEQTISFKEYKETA